MRAFSRLALLVLVGAWGCDRRPSKDSPSTPPQAAPPAALTSSPTASGAIPTASATPVPTPPGGATGAKPGLLVLPKIVLPNGTVPIHASLIGWSADGQWFGFCGASGEGMSETTCSEANVAGQVRSADRTTRRGQASAPLDPSPVIWRYGGELRLSWEVQEPGYLPDGPPHRAAAFVLSGGVVGEQESYVLDRVVIAPDNPDVSLHLDAISPLADGSALGAVIHGYSGEWTDTYHLRAWSTDDLASRIFNGIGLEHHKAGRYDAAAAFFRRATRALASSKASYNLACALAQMGDAQARDALKTAIAIGGVEVVEKARKDRDFDGVRHEPWFAELVP